MAHQGVRNKGTNKTHPDCGTWSLIHTLHLRNFGKTTEKPKQENPLMNSIYTMSGFRNELKKASGFKVDLLSQFIKY